MGSSAGGAGSFLAPGDAHSAVVLQEGFKRLNGPPFLTRLPF